MQHIFLWWTCRSYKGTKYILDFLSPLRKENRNEKLSFSCSFNPCQLQKCLLIQKFLMNRVANEREALYGTKCRRETFCPASCASLLWWSAGRNQWFQKVSEEKQQYLILIFFVPSFSGNTWNSDFKNSYTTKVEKKVSCSCCIPFQWQAVYRCPCQERNIPNKNLTISFSFKITLMFLHSTSALLQGNLSTLLFFPCRQLSFLTFATENGTVFY